MNATGFAGNGPPRQPGNGTSTPSQLTNPPPGIRSTNSSPQEIREYDTAVQLLVDLRELGERDGDSGLFQQRLAELRAMHARKPSLLERLNLAGLDT